jgi:hypothetical protein
MNTAEHATPALTASEVERLRTVSQAKLTEWTAVLRAAHVPLSRAVLCGSLATGLLYESKPAAYSNSPWPALQPNIIELDIRLIFTPGVDVTDPALLETIAARTGTRLARAGTITRWEAEIAMAVLYAHHPLDDRTALEWEICVNAEPYFESTPFWPVVFGPEELDQQRAVRSAAVLAGVARGDYEALKSYYGAEFRWRVSSSLAHLPTGLLPTALRQLATHVDGYPAVARMVAQARSGALARPEQPALLARTSAMEGRDPVTVPEWVALLEHVPGP